MHIAPFVFGRSAVPWDFHFFPTRRSSDLKLDADWVRAAQTKEVNAWIAFYSDGAVVLPPNENIAATKDAIRDRKSTRLNSSHANISYAVFCLKKKKEDIASVALRVRRISL